MASSGVEPTSETRPVLFRFGSFRAQPRNEGGLGVELQIFLFFVVAVLIVLRRPDALFNAQFFAEDGAVWYPDAYTFGWFHSLLHSYNGYFQTLPRLAASLALLGPLRWAPLVMNLIGIAFQVLPVNILLSWRCANSASLTMRAVMAAAYIALPNTMELNATITAGQWHLALVACMLVLSQAPGKSVLWKIFDFVIVLLSGLTGPFCVFLLPIAVLFWWLQRGRFRLLIVAVLAATASIQLFAILQTASATRLKVPLGATLKLFVQILGGQVYLAAILGQNSLPAQNNIVVLAVAALLGTAVLVYCATKASLELRLFLLFAVCVFAASLANPKVSVTVPQWPVLRDALGIRYWFFPMLAFIWALIWCTRAGNNRAIRVAAVCVLMWTILGITADWAYPPYPDFHFPEHARQFETAAPGTLVTIPIYPPGWELQLTKKPRK